jgi:hypothetical protein
VEWNRDGSIDWTGSSAWGGVLSWSRYFQKALESKREAVAGSACGIFHGAGQFKKRELEAAGVVGIYRVYVVVKRAGVRQDASCLVSSRAQTEGRGRAL